MLRPLAPADCLQVALQQCLRHTGVLSHPYLTLL